MTDEGAVNGILLGLGHTINDAACALLGPKFLPMIFENNRCAEGSLASDIFDSYENFCKCINTNPCLSSAVISVGFRTKGFGDFVTRVGKCCRNEDVRITLNTFIFC